MNTKISKDFFTSNLAADLAAAGITKVIMPGMTTPPPLSEELVKEFAAAMSPVNTATVNSPARFVIDEQLPFF